MDVDVTAMVQWVEIPDELKQDTYHDVYRLSERTFSCDGLAVPGGGHARCGGVGQVVDECGPRGGVTLTVAHAPVTVNDR